MVKRKALLFAPAGTTHRKCNDANIRALMTLQYEVHLLGNFALTDSSQSANKEYLERCDKNGIIVHDLPFVRHSLRANLSLISKIRELINKEEFSLVHAHTETGGLLLRMAGRRTGAKYFYTPHGISFYHGSSLKSQMVYRPVERWICSGMDVTFTINREETAAVKKWKNTECIPIHGVGIDVAGFAHSETARHEIREQLNIPQTATVLLSVGELDDNKNQRVIIEAMGKIKRDGLFYVICGIGPNEALLKEIALKNGMGANVIFAGYRNDIPRVISACDIYAFPSFHEGLPISLMEAMAGGLPVVCSLARGNSELITDKENGFTFLPDDTDGAARALSAMLDSESARNRFVSKNKELISLYSSDNVCSELIKAYGKDQSL